MNERGVTERQGNFKQTRSVLREPEGRPFVRCHESKNPNNLWLTCMTRVRV